MPSGFEVVELDEQPSNILGPKVEPAPRKQSNAGAVDDFVQLRRAMIMCNACAIYRMPGNWMRKYGYTHLSGWRALNTCDYCQQRTQCMVYVREEGRLATEATRRERALQRAKERDPSIVIV